MLQALRTPCLILDADRMDHNIARLRARLAPMNVTLRPHLKTAKSIDVARRVMGSAAGPATVSTLEEAVRFADAGVTDMIYAVGIAPAKLDQVIALRRRGVDLAVLLDTVEQAEAVAVSARDARLCLPALIAIDCDGHRSGVKPIDAHLLVAIARRLEQGAELRGVLAHAGGSYAASDRATLRRHAEVERRSVVDACAVLRAAGFSCPVVSVGSTPTAHATVMLDGVTEVRAGVFVFFDLVQVEIGVCKIEDIALTVLTTVIGHQPDQRRIIVDAGWMAMSSERRTTRQGLDQNYGLVCDLAGDLYPGLVLASASQEHGMIEACPGSGADLPHFAIGDRLRIMPNHACATATQHDCYHVVRGQSAAVEAVWPRFRGW